MVYTTAAIMAIPSPLDSVRLVGDEEKHATLLYFGETSSLPDNARDILVDAVGMAAGMLHPFSESVREIARLGNDVPPALVALLSNSDLVQIRNLFAMNPFVESYRENAAQFPIYTPHVTLGYPDFVEEAKLRATASQLRRVSFDRLAVWWNDERIEFPLARYGEDETVPMEHAIAEFLEHVADLEDADAVLAHFGVKGQKWGVRRSEKQRESAAMLRRYADGTASRGDKVKTLLGTPTRPGGLYANRNAGKMADRIDRSVDRREARADVRAVKKASKQVVKDDKKYEASFRGVAGFIKVNNAIAAKVNPKIEALNNKPKYKDVDMLRVGNEKLHKSYLNEYRGVLQDSLDSVMSDFGTNASGTKRLQLNVVGEGLQTTWQASLDEIKHADATKASVLDGFRVIPTFNKLGQITGQKVEQLELAHTDDITNDVLAHYGIKGQKWGVRRSTDSSGLVARKSSADQIQTDRIVKKLQSGGTSALSNDDLKKFTERLRLEKEFSRAAAQHQEKAQSAVVKFIHKQAARQGNRLADKTVDIAVEQALALAGVKAEKAIRFGLSDNINELNKRIKPKKK